MPLQTLIVNPLKPASCMVGSSGRLCERALPVTASARSLPETTSGVAVFWSRFTRDDLLRLQTQRRAAWATAPPVHVALWSREDQYLAEGLWHAQARNVAWTSADLFTAWRENLILERFFEPVLDRPSDGAPAGVRWSPDQRALAATQMQFDPAFYLSHAAPPPIAEWPSWCLWLSVGAIVVAILTAC